MADDFVAWCSELLSCVGRVRVNRMFGARGFYVDEVFIAIVSGEQLYLKVDDENWHVLTVSRRDPKTGQTWTGRGRPPA